MTDACVQLLRDEDVLLEQPVGQGLSVGRNHVCGLILTDPRVSGLHAQFDLRGGRLFITDLGSRNGTWVGERRVIGTRVVADGDVVVLGRAARLRVKLEGATVARGPVLRDAKLGVAWRVEHPRTIDVGDVGSVDVRPTSDGRIAWTFGDQSGVARAGQALPIAPERLVVSAPPPSRGTIDTTLLPYRVSARLVGGHGAVVEISRLSGPPLARFQGTLQAMLIYVLAQAAHEDGDLADGGWRPDDILRSALWGAQYRKLARNTFNMVVSRTRQHLEDAGLDPACIEKKKGWTRLVVGDIDLHADAAAPADPTAAASR